MIEAKMSFSCLNKDVSMSTQLSLLIKNSKYKMLNFFMTRAEVYGELKKVHHFEWKSVQKPCS